MFYYDIIIRIYLYWGNYKIIYLSVFFVCAVSQMALVEKACVISALCSVVTPLVCMLS
jgi:hypothetical protein